MDALVKAALLKWPNVPHCHGWLALDARGDWYMRDDRTQAAGPFPQVKGSRIQHAKLLAFILRNYACDADGAWFFQNGPQRVYVQLEATPFVWRVADEGHNVTVSVQNADLLREGLAPGEVAPALCGPVPVLSSWLDEPGHLYLHTPFGLGLVHTLDMGAAAEAIERGLWAPQSVKADELPGRFGFQRQPQPPGQGWATIAVER
jgi:hypothetical protein